jgi:hypothetical protein
VFNEEPQLHEEPHLQLPDVQQHVEVLNEEPQLPDVQQQLQLLQQLQNLGVLQQLLNGGMLQQLQQQQQQNGGPAHLVMLAPLSHSNDHEEEENGNLTDFESKFWYPKFLLYFLYFYL